MCLKLLFTSARQNGYLQILNVPKISEVHLAFPLWGYFLLICPMAELFGYWESSAKPGLQCSRLLPGPTRGMNHPLNSPTAILSPSHPPLLFSGLSDEKKQFFFVKKRKPFFSFLLFSGTVLQVQGFLSFPTPAAYFPSHHLKIKNIFFKGNEIEIIFSHCSLQKNTGQPC